MIGGTGTVVLVAGGTAPAPNSGHPQQVPGTWVMYLRRAEPVHEIVSKAGMNYYYQVRSRRTAAVLLIAFALAPFKVQLYRSL